MNNENIVNSIKDLCKSKNITVGQLEKDVGLSQGLVSKWINTTPSLDKIIEIADYFQVSLDKVVSRNQDINDTFLNILFAQTEKSTIEWSTVTPENPLSLFSKIYDRRDIPLTIYDEDNYKQTTYIAEFNNGFISIYAYHENNNILNPIEIKLFIQPTYDSTLIEQDYNREDLLKIWIKVLNSLGDNAPDEVKAEDFKNTFVNKFKEMQPTKKKKSIIVVTNSTRQNKNSLKELFLNESIDSIAGEGSSLLNRNNNTIVAKDKYAYTTEKGKEFYYNNKSIIGEISEARFKNYKDLYLISDSHIMKLSGFTWGEECGATSFNGLLEILNDAGFEVNQFTSFSGENFSLFPPIN